MGLNFCKPFWKKHRWLRHGPLVEQLFVGGFYAWQRCAACGEIKFDKATHSKPPVEAEYKESTK